MAELSLQDLIRRRQARGFVGRQAELGQFQENLDIPLEDARRRFLFSVHGDAGVGKSFLARQFIRLARERGYVTAYIDESVFDLPAAMDVVAAELARQDRPCRDFTKRSEAYRKHRHELDVDPDAPEGLSSALTRSAVRIGLRAAGDIPVVGPFAKELNSDIVVEQADRLRVFLTRKLRDQRDVRLLLAPVDELTPTFVDDLRAVADQQPVALFFDTYERTGAFLNPWLLDLLAGRYGALPPNLVLTIAGQHPLDVNTWGDYLGIRADIPLQVFTDAEARELLAARGVTDPRVVEVILGLTARLPVLVALLAEARPDSVEDVTDPGDNAVERFLKWEKDEQRRTAALRGALPRRLDRETYAAATDSTSIDEDFAWLRGLPFVAEHADGYRYHDVVRDTMLRVQRRRSPSDWQQRHTTLAEHHRTAREALGLSGRVAWRDQHWQASAIEEHYHRLCAQPTTALPAALAALIDTIDNDMDSADRWTTMIQQAGVDANAPNLSDRGGQLARWSTKPGDRVAVLKHLAAVTALDDHHRAIALGERGFLLLQSQQLTEALADLHRAIGLDSENKWVTAYRGEAYRLMGRYAEALADLNRAVELNPDMVWAIASRGQTYRLMGRYAEALVDFDRAVESDPEYVWAIGNRGRTYRAMGRYTEALADFSCAVELAQESGWIVAGRGETYRLMGRHADALVDFDRAIELKPEYGWTICSRGQTYRAMGRYAEALADFNRAIELRPLAGFNYYQAGLLAVVQGNTDVGRDFLAKAIEIDSSRVDGLPNGGWLAFNVAVYYIALGQLVEAERRIREVLAQGCYASDVGAAIRDLQELHHVTGRDVSAFVELLAGGSAGVEHLVQGDRGQVSLVDQGHDLVE